MKIAVFGDVHLSRYSQDKVEDETNLPERLASIKRVLYEISNYCNNSCIKNIAIVGDISHNKSIIYSIAQDLMLDYFKNNPDITFFVIDGNHDLSSKGEEAVSALKPLEHVSNVKWVSHKTTLKLEDEDIIFIPYSHKLPEVIKSNRAKILFSHFGLSEAVLNSGISIVSDVSLRDLVGKYELVILGHYHKPQEIINDKIKFYYTGSLIELDWGEKNEEKRFLIVDTDTLQVDSVPIKSYKKHIEVEITEDNKDEIIKLYEKAKLDGNHFKVIMKNSVDLTNIPSDINIVNKIEKDITNRGITSSMSVDDKLKMYVEIKQIPEGLKELFIIEAKGIIDDCEEI